MTAKYIVKYIFEDLFFFVFFSLEDSLQFYSWEFDYNTSLAHVSFIQNKLLQNFLSNNKSLYFRSVWDKRTVTVWETPSFIPLWKANGYGKQNKKTQNFTYYISHFL